jgi:hypothetical protein
MSNWKVVVEEDPETGELVMPFPPDLLAQVGWDFGDVLIWEEVDGGWSLRRKDDGASE